MSDYYPDAWTLVKVTKGTEPHYRVMAHWYGGYAGGDSWKMSSGVTKVEVNKGTKEIEFHNVSGSIYYCHPNVERMSMYLHSIFKAYEEANGLEIVSPDEIDPTLFLKESND